MVLQRTLSRLKEKFKVKNQESTYFRRLSNIQKWNQSRNRKEVVCDKGTGKRGRMKRHKAFIKLEIKGSTGLGYIGNPQHSERGERLTSSSGMNTHCEEKRIKMIQQGECMKWGKMSCGGK